MSEAQIAWWQHVVGCTGGECSHVTRLIPCSIAPPVQLVPGAYTCPLLHMSPTLNSILKAHTLPPVLVKVSRRLTRRIKKALYDRQLGFVRVAVAAFCHLLDESCIEGSTYTFNYFNQELIHQPDTVVSAAAEGQVTQKRLNSRNLSDGGMGVHG